MIAYENPVFKELKHGKNIRTPWFGTNVNSFKTVYVSFDVVPSKGFEHPGR